MSAVCVYMRVGIWSDTCARCGCTCVPGFDSQFYGHSPRYFVEVDFPSFQRAWSSSRSAHPQSPHNLRHHLAGQVTQFPGAEEKELTGCLGMVQLSCCSNSGSRTGRAPWGALRPPGNGREVADGISASPLKLPKLGPLSPNSCLRSRFWGLCLY